LVAPFLFTGSFHRPAKPLLRCSDQQKNPRTVKPPAAGKCLNEMDLPSAGGKPSPPVRLRRNNHFARRSLNTQSRLHPQAHLGS